GGRSEEYDFGIFTPVFSRGSPTSPCDTSKAGKISLLYLRKRTFVTEIRMSALGQKRTSLRTFQEKEAAN
ncbi:MAG: hypothetical protein WA704_02925, partial [Pseudolabrys sp.]